jgi:indolepyruvate ferredoxin oxidoreductase
MLPIFKVLAKLKGLRGTAFDIFGYSEERRAERRLIAGYEKTIRELLGKLDRDNVKTAVEIASVPEHIRGYGHVKTRHLRKALQREAALMSTFSKPQSTAKAA